MIVYGERKRRVRTRVPPGNWRDTLIRFGEIEAALADAVSPERDAPHPLLAQLRAISLRLASGDTGALDDVPPLPEEVCISVPEGYAYYALYPEDYAAAARRFRRDARPRQAVVIGIRSIGTSLSAVVAAELRQAGCAVRSFTVRPRGHPFDRRIAWDEFDCGGDAWHLIVDEGPGLSGSSFASVARALSERGVPDERIVLFPSWDADGSTFCSSAAAAQWRRHRRYTETAERFPGCRDLSAGKWRELFPVAPAVQPQHERRKYLRDGALLKFEGFADYGRARFERAGVLADAGFSPRPLHLEDGYLVSEFVAGEPVAGTAPELLHWISRYLRFIESRFPSDRPVPYEENLRMIHTNVLEGLGPDWAARLDRLERFRSPVCDAATVRIDGRVFPYEFLRTSGGYIKTDALDHHDDHFFPGCQDIAWDAAAVAVEFDCTNFGNPKWEARLPFYLVAYLSYRLGYCLMAAQSSPDAAKFCALADGYAARLRDEIDRLC